MEGQWSFFNPCILQAENTMREFILDAQGRMWFGTPANNKVGYFYLAGTTLRAGD
jgi:hypothetical protein